MNVFAKMRDLKTRFRAIKVNFFVITVIAVSAYILTTMYVFREITFNKNKTTSVSAVSLSNVIVHIDLKSTPLKLSYLESLFPMMKRYGVNGLLMEYEDMFPYEGRLANLSAEFHYSRSELKQFLRSAKKSALDIIPLVQTFGHLEYALKLAEFHDLREVPLYPDSICPSKMESLVFLEELLSQVIDLHRFVIPLKYLHIGCDEVYHMNQCNHCRERPEIFSNKDLLLHHIRSVSEIVKSLSGETTILVWDDMFRDIKAHEWINIEPFHNVHPVYWDYGSTLRVMHQHLYMYHKKFPHIWIASAYKGADGRTATIPDFKSRFFNNFRWMEYILGYKFGGESLYNFEGIILTGWSRYSHMDPPCELLPVSIPSLILNLLVVQKFKSGITDEKHEIEMEFIDRLFNNHINIEFNERYKCLINFFKMDFATCKFDGRELYNVVIQFVLFNNEITMSLVNEDNSIVSLEYYSKAGTINMNNVQRIKGHLEIQLQKLKRLENQTMTEISKYYHPDFAREYVDNKSFDNKGKLRKMLEILNNYTHTRSWNKRTISNVSNLRIVH